MSVLYVKDNQGNITQIRTIRGEKGIDGLGISAAEINENGELVLTYTDGNIVNLYITSSSVSSPTSIFSFFLVVISL